MNLSYISVLKEERGGFDFSQLKRNNMLLQEQALGNKQNYPLVLKTGTTICGLITKDAIVLGADTRATEGPIVADKKCQKLHRLADNIWTAGAGTAADLDHVTFNIESQIELLRLSMGKTPRVASAVSRFSQLLFKYQGHICCALVLGGVDCKGPQLFKIHPHGSTDRLPFCAMGSGSLNALTVLESMYRDNMTVEDGQRLVAEAIRSGIYNDLGSGGNVDIVTITANQPAQYIRGFDACHDAKPQLFRHPTTPLFSKGKTPILKSEIQEMFKSSVVVEDVDMTSVEVMS
jgi:20S proteasome subunit beta 2